ncbi:MAG TPA: FtsQ-type POTRA domain-containing protein [Rhizobiaceae bacterium]|nr:FtsQ-type POTRA domain-containing protein [Rhizobiaceae bacterium]
MLSLGRKDSASAPDPAGVVDAGGLVLPRFLRKPVRHFSRIFSREALLQPRVLLGAAAIVAGLAGSGYVVQSGLGELAVAKSTAFAGFKIEDVEINGVKEVSRIDVLTNIDLGVERSLFSFDVHAARKALRKLPWVAEARVAKAYPDRVIIDIVEKSAFAVWQNNGELWLIERDGKKIVPFEERFAGLPLVVGAGAAEKSAEFIAMIGRHPVLAERVNAHVRIGERRWNLVMDTGVTVKLPEGGEAAELGELARIEAEGALMSRDIGEIDMRISDRLVVRLTPEAAARLESEKKAGKKKPGEDT